MIQTSITLFIKTITVNFYFLYESIFEKLTLHPAPTHMYTLLLMYNIVSYTCNCNTCACTMNNLKNKVTMLFQISAQFRRDTEQFFLTDQDRRSSHREGLQIDPSQRKLVYRGLGRLPQNVIYYWSLPQKFLGNKVCKLAYEVHVWFIPKFSSRILMLRIYPYTCVHIHVDIYKYTSVEHIYFCIIKGYCSSIPWFFDHALLMNIKFKVIFIFMYT